MLENCDIIERNLGSIGGKLEGRFHSSPCQLNSTAHLAKVASARFQVIIDSPLSIFMPKIIA